MWLRVVVMTPKARRLLKAQLEGLWDRCVLGGGSAVRSRVQRVWSMRCGSASAGLVDAGVCVVPPRGAGADVEGTHCSLDLVHRRRPAAVMDGLEDEEEAKRKK